MKYRKIMPFLWNFTIFFMTVELFSSMVAYGQAVTPPQVISNEQAHIRPVTVVQNRFFKKALRPELSLFGGTVLNEAYSSTFAGGARLSFFINEFFGVDYGYTKYSYKSSPDLIALNNITVSKKNQATGEFEAYKISPSYVLSENSQTFLASFIPIYGKINFFDSVILYSDIYLSIGTGILETSAWKGMKIIAGREKETKYPFIAGIGQRFYIAKYFNCRIDAWDSIFSETRENMGKKETYINQSWLIAFGISAFLWGDGT